MKITDKMRAEWLMRKDTQIRLSNTYPYTWWEAFDNECIYQRHTKWQAINAAIRAEAKGKK